MTPPLSEKPRKAGDFDSGGTEEVQDPNEIYDQDMPLLIRRFTFSVPQALAPAARALEEKPAILFLAALFGCIGASASLFFGILIGFLTVLSMVTLPVYQEYRHQLRLHQEKKRRQRALALKNNTVCLLCGESYHFGRREDADEVQRIYPRGCRACGKSICLDCGVTTGEPEEYRGTPVVEKSCPGCIDSESRWEL